jgi:hypothetical protein
MVLTEGSQSRVIQTGLRLNLSSNTSSEFVLRASRGRNYSGQLKNLLIKRGCQSSLGGLVDGKSHGSRSIRLPSLITCNHPRDAAGNKIGVVAHPYVIKSRQ